MGINCTPPRYIASLVSAARVVTDAPIIVYPNSGETYVAGEGRWEAGAHCVPFVDAARNWVDAGATIIGGCCRTTPADIQSLHRWIATRAR